MMNFKKIIFCGIALLLTVMTVGARDSKFTRHGAGRFIGWHTNIAL